MSLIVGHNQFQDVTLENVLSIFYYFLTVDKTIYRKNCSLYLSVHSSGLETIVIAIQRGHNHFYG